MYAAPPVIKTEIFARVPDRLRAKENARLQSGVARDCFLEGPSFDRDGNLYVTNIPYGQIFRISPTGEFTLVATYDGEPNGLKIHKDGMGPDGMAMDAEGNLAICHVGMGSVWLFSRLGRPLGEIQSCAGLGTTNAAYGGPQRKTLYITDSETGAILSARLDVPGKEMYSHL